MQTIILSGTSYELQATTGTILDASKNLETKVSGGGGGGFSHRGSGFTNRVNIKSTTVVHDQFFIKDNNGTEHSFQLSHFDLACREGNQISVVAAFRQGKKNGPYIAVINHSTSKIFFSNDALKTIGGPNKFLLTGIFLVLAVIGFASVGAGFFGIALLLMAGTFGYYLYAHSQDIKQLKRALNQADFTIPAIN